MNDYIKREDAIEAMENRFADIIRTHKRRVTTGEKAIANDMIETAKMVKSADVVAVVRCKDCRWKEECVITELWGGGNGYCRSGERKDDEDR